MTGRVSMTAPEPALMTQLADQGVVLVLLAVQGRMADTNRNLTAKTLLLLGELAKATGPAFEGVGRPLLSTAVGNISDTKSQVCSCRATLSSGTIRCPGSALSALLFHSFGIMIECKSLHADLFPC